MLLSIIIFLILSVVVAVLLNGQQGQPPQPPKAPPMPQKKGDMVPTVAASGAKVYSDILSESLTNSAIMHPPYNTGSEVVELGSTELAAAIPQTTEADVYINLGLAPFEIDEQNVKYREIISYGIYSDLEVWPPNSEIVEVEFLWGPDYEDNDRVARKYYHDCGIEAMNFDSLYSMSPFTVVQKHSENLRCRVRLLAGTGGIPQGTTIILNGRQIVHQYVADLV